MSASITLMQGLKQSNAPMQRPSMISMSFEPTHSWTVEPSLAPSSLPSHFPSRGPSIAMAMNSSSSPSIGNSLSPSSDPSKITPIEFGSIMRPLPNADATTSNGEQTNRAFLCSVLGILGGLLVVAGILHTIRRKSKRRINTIIYRMSGDAVLSPPSGTSVIKSNPTTSSSSSALSSQKHHQHQKHKPNGERPSDVVVSADSESHVDLYVNQSKSIDVSELYDSPSQVADRRYFQQSERGRYNNEGCDPFFAIANLRCGIGRQHSETQKSAISTEKRDVGKVDIIAQSQLRRNNGLGTIDAV